MTKFILHGGGASRPSINNRNFFKEMLKFGPKSKTILLVYFSRPKNRWQNLFKQDEQKFLTMLPKRILKLLLANEKPSIFIKQIKSAHIIYIRGGSNSLLKRRILKIKNLSKLLKGKIIAGSSAGANMISKYYYSADHYRVEYGLGILPIKVFCHYNKAKDKEKLRELKSYKEILPIYTIAETEYENINI